MSGTQQAAAAGTVKGATIVTKAPSTPAPMKKSATPAPTREEPTLAGLRDFLKGKDVFLYAAAGTLAAAMNDPMAAKDGYAEIGPVRCLDLVQDQETGRVVTILYRAREKGSRKYESVSTMSADGLCISVQQERLDQEDEEAVEPAADTKTN
jgi:hypothetical protein